MPGSGSVCRVRHGSASNSNSCPTVRVTLMMMILKADHQRYTSSWISRHTSILTGRTLRTTRRPGDILLGYARDIPGYIWILANLPHRRFDVLYRIIPMWRTSTTSFVLTVTYDVLNYDVIAFTHIECHDIRCRMLSSYAISYVLSHTS